MSDAHAALRIDLSANGLQVREELDRTTAAFVNFAKRTGTEITAAGKQAAARVGEISASMGGLGESMRGAQAAVQVTSKALEAMGDKLSPLSQSAANAVTQLAGSGFTPLGLAIGVATTALVAFIAANREELPAEVTAARKHVEELTAAWDDFAVTLRMKELGESRPIARMRNDLVELTAAQAKYAATIDDLRPRVDEAASRRGSVNFDPERSYGVLAAKLRDAQVAYQRIAEEIKRVTATLDEQLTKESKLTDADRLEQQRKRLSEFVTRMAADNAKAFDSQESSDLFDQVFPGWKLDGFEAEADAVQRRWHSASQALTKIAAENAAALDKQETPDIFDQIFPSWKLEDFEREADAAAKRAKELRDAQVSGAQQLADRMRALNLEIHIDGLSATEAEVARLRDETDRKIDEYQRLGLSTVELEQRTQERIAQIRASGEREATERAVEETKKRTRDVELAARQAREEIRTSSFGGGFGVTLDDTTRRMTDLSLAGERVGESLTSGLGGAFSSIARNAESAGDAFEGFGRRMIDTLLDIEAQWAAGQLVKSLGGALNLPGFNASGRGVDPSTGVNLSDVTTPSGGSGAWMLSSGPVTMPKRAYRELDAEGLGSSRAKGLVVEYHDEVGVRPQTQRARGPNGEERLVITLKRLIADDIETGGEVGRSIEKSFGTRRSPRRT